MPDIVGSHNGSQVLLKVAVLPVEDDDHFPDRDRLSKFPKLHVLDALVDTGAQGTCITRRAAQELGLTPIGLIPVQGVSGIQYHNNYLFQIGFADIQQHEIGFAGSEMHIFPQPIEGAEFDSGNADFDILLGMNVISTGDLTITGRAGQVVVLTTGTRYCSPRNRLFIVAW